MSDTMETLRRAVAELLHQDVETWPEHGNAPLAIAAALAIRIKEVETLRALARKEDESNGVYPGGIWYCSKCGRDHAGSFSCDDLDSAVLRLFILKHTHGGECKKDEPYTRVCACPRCCLERLDRRGRAIASPLSESSTHE